MTKHCIICGKDAKFALKGASGYYCEQCAKESFSDLDLLESLESQARALKERLKNKE